MASAATFQAWAESLDQLSYYGILRVRDDASEAEIKEAFHTLALRCHPDRYVDDEEEVGRAAAQVFKRGAEAYAILGKATVRSQYDKLLARGKLRMAPSDIVIDEPKPVARTLETIARDPRAKQFARKADLLLSVGRLDDARVQLISACQNEPHNEELNERLQILYEALALEPL